jgi:hypothetical protein
LLKETVMTKMRKAHVYHAVLAEVSIDRNDPDATHLDVYSVDDEFHFVMPRATLQRLSRQTAKLLAGSPAPESKRPASQATIPPDARAR